MSRDTWAEVQKREKYSEQQAPLPKIKAPMRVAGDQDSGHGKKKHW